MASVKQHPLGQRAKGGWAVSAWWWALVVGFTAGKSSKCMSIAAARATRSPGALFKCTTAPSHTQLYWTVTTPHKHQLSAESYVL